MPPPQNASLRLRLLRGLAALSLLLGLAPPASALLLSEFGDGGAPGEDGESVELSGSLVVAGADPAELIGAAFGGRGGSAPEGGGAAGSGGAVALGPLYAASDTGDVSVAGSAVGGGGGFAMLEDAAGSGASVLLHDAVDGDTAGALELFQSATGGSAGIGVGGQAGRAVSMLQRSKSAESFELRTRAFGGGAPRAPRGSVGDIDGAPAQATAHGVNDAGSLRVIAGARGGSAGASFTDGAGDGGDASALAFARTTDDGQPVFVGVIPTRVGGGGRLCGEPSSNLECLSEPEAEAGLTGTLGGEELPRPGFPPLVFLPDVGAVGGPGGSYLSTFLPPFTPPAGDGGEASSVSIGVAEGDSPVDVADLAVGGAGGFQVGVEQGGPAAGGSGRSVAVGVGRGSSPVKVAANATGGAAGSVRRSSGSIGDPPSPFPALDDSLPGAPANATAVAIGSGEVGADARATAGVGTGSEAPDLRHPGGPARAMAKGVGSDGQVTASAKSSSETLLVGASARASVRTSADGQARIGPPSPRSGWQHALGRLAHRAGARDASVDATVAPDDRAVARALRRQRELRQALEHAGVDTFDALGSFRARQRQGGRGDLVTSALEVELAPFFSLLPGSDPVFIGLFAPRLTAVGFESLHVTLSNGDDLLVDELLTDAAEARAFLAGTLLEVGSIGGSGNPFPPGALADIALLRIELVTSSPGAGLGLDFLVGQAPPQEPLAP